MQRVRGGAAMMGGPFPLHVVLALCVFVEAWLVIGGIALIAAGVCRKAIRQQCVCGYSLLALSSTSDCPECGRAIAERARLQRKRGETTITLGIACLVFALILPLGVILLFHLWIIFLEWRS